MKYASILIELSRDGTSSPPSPGQIRQRSWTKVGSQWPELSGVSISGSKNEALPRLALFAFLTRLEVGAMQVNGQRGWVEWKKDQVPGEAAARQSEKVRAHFAERAESLARAMNIR